MPTKVNSLTLSRFLNAHVVLLLLSFIAIVCFASAISVSKEYNEQHGMHNYADDGRTTGLEWPNGIALSSVFASFAWTVFVLLRPIHNQLLNPGYSVGLDCFSWVYITVCCISGAIFSGYQDYDTAKASTIKSLEIVAYLCAFIMIPIHFTLFVYACQATQIRNQALLVEEIMSAIEWRMAPTRSHLPPNSSSGHTSVSVPIVLDV